MVREPVVLESHQSQALADGGALRSRPAKPAREAQREVHARSALAVARQHAKRLWVHAAQRGVFGLVPLRGHVVICGFPRSGTTLLSLMVQTSVPNALCFGRERFALLVAQRVWPGRHEFIVTKRPSDIFWINEIRDHYASCPSRAEVRFVVCTRDPRAVLTSFHANKTDYYVSVERWRTIYDHLSYVKRFRDVCLVDFREIVSDVATVQRRMTELVGWSPASDFADFHVNVPQGFDTSALNGVRGLDASTLNKWARPEHHERIRTLLREMPELPDRLMEMGYESDTTWTASYR